MRLDSHGPGAGELPCPADRQGGRGVVIPADRYFHCCFTNASTSGKPPCKMR